MKELDLVAMLCSRLCHDLVGPISALANGVEVLQDDDDADMRDAAVELLAHSSKIASNRVKFYRMAFGASGGAGIILRSPISVFRRYGSWRRMRTTRANTKTFASRMVSRTET